MRLPKNSIRRLRNAWKKMRRRKCEVCLAATACFLILMWLLQRSKQSTYSNSSYCTPIDVVYTWVNGSDPIFIEALRSFNPDYDPARFDDKNELRYSLRSLEVFAPWVRHVYIVTNGQIPHWLDLNYDRVTIVPHEVLVPQTEMLPTFSSAAIETFIHRIPQLSQRFLYLNDDIFLGAPLYPEDLYTDGEGVRIYQAWMVPDCAEDCPWTYIGDGACDRHCNIAECQYDGGDCSSTGGGKSEEELIEHVVEHPKLSPMKLVKKNETAYVEKRKFPLRKRYRNLKQIARNSSTFKEIVRSKNLTTLMELHSIVENYNKKLKSKPHSVLVSSSTVAPEFSHKTYKSTKDIFSQSLIHTNMLLNRHYGFKARNVLAHVGFLLERDIIEGMQAKFANEVHATARHRFRATDDLQFAFAYYTFLMSETKMASVEDIFDEFDTDLSHTWSDREVRTFLARMYPLPLDWSAVRFFEEVVTNCSRQWGSDKKEQVVPYSTLVYERYEDSNVPTISRELVGQCTLLAEALHANFALRPKYKYNISSKRNVHSNFMMLTSNVTEVVYALDKMRRDPRKFNCINDNLEPRFTEDNELIRHLLQDFYLSFFPRRSKFELQLQFRNRFTNWPDYQRWRRRKRAALVVAYLASFVLIVFLLRFLCMHKAKFARRYVQRL